MDFDIAYLERVKIQAEILLPLFRRLREELGEPRACELIRAAVHDYATELGQSIAGAHAGTSLARLKAAVPVFTAGDALDIETLRDDADELSFNVRGCRYAEYFQALGEPLLGAMLTCEIDPPMTAAIGADLSLDRKQTLMQGGSLCDFRWKLESSA
jgi:hypothetical protein